MRHHPLVPIVALLVLASAACGAPKKQPLLKKGDRLAIVGDSITFMKKYSRVIDLYLTASQPQLEIFCIQNARSGETTRMFINKRIKKNCIELYKPTVVTTCYGFNDGGWKAYDSKTGNKYKTDTREMVKIFKRAKVRVILGSPGIAGSKLPNEREYNDTLSHLTEIAENVARQTKSPFVNVHTTMLTAQKKMRAREGKDYCIVARDGAHSDWPGHMAMAIAFLRAMKLDGEIARIMVDLDTGKATVNEGHKILASEGGAVTVESSRFPFYFFYEHPSTNLADMWKVAEELGFFEDLNRFMLIVKTRAPGKYAVKWGGREKTFASTDLAKGINLAHEFPKMVFNNVPYHLFHAIGFKFDIQTHIQDGTADRESEWIEKVLMKDRKGETLDMQKALKDPEQLNMMAQENVLRLMKPVVHKIEIRKL